jgi:D-cysteine desulfhydrase
MSSAANSFGRPRLALAHLPTPLVQPRRLADALGVDLWIKRDDMTGGPEAGNKLRKLEFLFAEARELGADTVITCGGIQSNHARATAIVATSLGLHAVLLLRVTEGSLDPKDAPLAGNVLLDKLVGAELRLITPAQYRDRTRQMEAVAEELRARGKRPYVIPEGGSNALGALGYVEAMREIRAQLDATNAAPFDVVAHACGSGGTAAGVAVGARMFDVAHQTRAYAVCDDARTFQDVIARIVGDLGAIDPRLGITSELVVDDTAKGPGYAISSAEQRATIIEAGRLSGLIFDPVYTGKALHGVVTAARRGELSGKRVLFLHTGGLPGLLAQGETFRTELS